MAHGTPDWWGSEPGSTIHQIQDAGELAARLGSEDTFDRRGNVIWLSGFERGLQEVRITESGSGASVDLSIATALKGAYSCKLTTGTTLNRLAAISKFISLPVFSEFGGEIAFTWNLSLELLTLEFNLYDGTDHTYWAIKLDPSTHKAYYYRGVDDWVEIATIPSWPTTTYVFHVAKLVIDLDDKEYVRLILDDQEYSLDGISTWSEGDPLAPHLEFFVGAWGPAAASKSIYVDDMILTQNEP